MRCEEVRRTIDLYLDGEFGPEEKGAIEHHLSECEECSAFTNRQYRLKQGVKTAFSQVKAPFRLELTVQHGLIRQARQRTMHFGMAFAVVLMLALMIWMFLPQVMNPTRPQIVQARPQGQVIPINPPVSTGQRQRPRPVPPPFVPVNYTP